MARKYSRITQDERVQIATLKKEGYSPSKIAKAIGRAPSSISREIKRNSSPKHNTYNADRAQKRFEERQQLKRKPWKFTADMQSFIKDKLLHEQWSPEQISCWCKEQNIPMVSTEWIYHYIYQSIREGNSQYSKHLRRSRKKRKRRLLLNKQRAAIPDRVSITQRPKEVETRNTFGHWEADTIVGNAHQGAVFTLVERKTRYTYIIPVGSKQASNLAHKVCQQLSEEIPWFSTITFDNGLEFAEHSYIAEQLGADTYFAHPYASHERGTNENTNGLIRQYLPKTIPLDNVSAKQAAQIQDKLNNRPRKCLGFLTPLQAINLQVNNTNLNLH